MSQLVLVQNSSRRIEDPPRVRICDTFASRFRGMMFRSNIARDYGLLLIMSDSSRLDSSIHMLFVPFDLAVFWIDANMQIIDKAIAKSWRPAYIPSAPARYVLEIHPDLRAAYEVGETVEFVNV